MNASSLRPVRPETQPFSSRSPLLEPVPAAVLEMDAILNDRIRRSTNDAEICALAIRKIAIKRRLNHLVGRELRVAADRLLVELRRGNEEVA